MSSPSTRLEDMKDMATFIAVVVRNAVETFHTKHLSDAQMSELNQIVRDSAFTALHAARLRGASETARAWRDYQLEHIPPYWESPELLDGYVRAMSLHGEDLDAV